jgi:hypothetical protein
MSSRENASAPARGTVRSRQVCDHCGRPFGMVTHRWWGSKFCRRRCKNAYLREIIMNRYAIHRWCSLLDLPVAPGNGGS